jgi:hypothetical protein
VTAFLAAGGGGGGGGGGGVEFRLPPFVAGNRSSSKCFALTFFQYLTVTIYRNKTVAITFGL